WEVCGEAADGREAVEKVAQLKPDLVLLGIAMPSVNGLEATRQIVQNDSKQKIIILGATEADQIVREVFDAGALGFVLRANATRDLVSAINALLDGRTFFTPRIAESILQDCLKGDIKRESVEATLTERERRNLQLLAKEVSTALVHPWGKRAVAHPIGKYL